MKNKLPEKFTDAADTTLREAVASLQKRDYLKSAELTFAALRAMREDDRRYKKAEDMLYIAAIQAPDRIAGRIILGEHYLFSCKYEEAMVTFKEAACLSSDNKLRAELFMYCASTRLAAAMDGHAHEKYGRLDEAVEYYLTAADCGANLVAVYFALMSLSGLRDDHENMCLYAMKTINVADPDSLPAILAKRRLAQVSNSRALQSSEAVEPLPLMN